MAASASFTFTGAAGSLLKLGTTAGATVTATLDNLAGVSSVAWDIFSTDETGTSHTITTSGAKGSVATLTAGVAGTAGILRCTVSDGSSRHVATAKWYVPATNGAEVGCLDETDQSSATYHTTGLLNGAIRKAAASESQSALLASATPNATPSTLALRGSSAQASFGYLTFGNTPAQSGYIRTANAQTAVSARNAANSADLPLVRTTGFNFLLLGDATLPAVEIDAASSIYLAISGQVVSEVGLGYIGISAGGSTSTSGNVRLENNATIAARDVGDGADIEMMTLDNNDALRIGTGSSGIALMGPPSFGGGSGVVFLVNRGFSPTTNPTNGVIIYAEAGALKARGSSGTTTTIATADPHCDRCGYDFALEWENDGEYLAVCVRCMVDELGLAKCVIGKRNR